jgi:hypothetical protein
MKTLEVTAKIGKENQPGYVPPVKINYPMPETLAEMVSTFGEGVVYNHVKSSVTVALQSFVRTKLDPDRDGGTMTEEQIQAEITGDGSEENPGWKPGARNPGKTAAEKVKEQFQKMDPDLRRQLLAELAKGGALNAPEVQEDESENQENGEDVEEAVEKPETHQRGSRRR